MSDISSLPLVIPTPDDFHSLSKLQTLAFAKENGEHTTKQLQESQRNNYLAYQRFHKECPTHLNHCRIIKKEDCDDGVVVAAIQLQVRKRRPLVKNHSSQGGSNGDIQVFIEWIGCHPEYEGKGLGSKLLSWAMTYTKKTLQVDVLSLYVVQANQRALQLYKYKGFVLASDNRRKCRNNSRKGKNKSLYSIICSKSMEKIVSILCLGLNKYWTVLEMEKDLLHLPR